MCDDRIMSLRDGERVRWLTELIATDAGRTHLAAIEDRIATLEAGGSIAGASDSGSASGAHLMEAGKQEEVIDGLIAHDTIQVRGGCWLCLCVCVCVCVLVRLCGGVRTSVGLPSAGRKHHC